jgi:2-polyprenyl-3-methyl-5-hydroxy-6-metoxy-1,4-benzoquinol methylase
VAAFPRKLEPEWLDHLPSDDPLALQSRRDLRLLNRVMGHASLLKRALLEHWGNRGPRSILDLGSGDGTLMLRLAEKLAHRWQNVSVTLLDREKLVSETIRERIAATGWTLELWAPDVFECLETAKHRRFDVVSANLFLHHFHDADLISLFRRISHMTGFLIALEPRRNWQALIGGLCVGLLGCNSVTRHDARVSVRAGFVSDELSKLWPARPGWRLRESPAGLFSHSFVATHHDQLALL